MQHVTHGTTQNGTAWCVAPHPLHARTVHCTLNGPPHGETQLPQGRNKAGSKAATQCQTRSTTHSRRWGQCLHIRQGPNKTALGKHSACLNETLRLQEHNKAAILTSLHYILRNPAARVWPSTWVQEPSTCDQTYVVSGDKSWGNKRLQQHTLKDRTTVTAQEQPQERSKSKLGSWHKPS
jgi:hypothetical protein